LDKSGNLYVSDSTAGTITEITTGGMRSTFASGLNTPSYMAFDSSGNLYVTNSGAGTITKITSGGTPSLFASGLNGPFGLAFDPSSGNLFVSNAPNFAPDMGFITQITPQGAETTYATGLTGPLGEAFALVPEPSGTVLLVTFAGVALAIRRRRAVAY
jgi:DNA-binding beta-propeller fold protein YncE